MEKKKKGHNIVEKIIFVFGIIVLISLISFLIYQIPQKNQGPPELVITTSYKEDIKPYGFEVKVENIGKETAEEAQVRFQLYQEGKATEEGTIGFRYVPVRSEETGWIVFHNQKKPGDSLVVSSVTYVKP